MHKVADKIGSDCKEKDGCRRTDAPATTEKSLHVLLFAARPDVFQTAILGFVS